MGERVKSSVGSPSKFWWSFYLGELETCLFRHHERIRYLHLIGCQCKDPYTTSIERVKQTWPKQLWLDGVEIVSLQFEVGATADTHLEKTHICSHRVADPRTVRTWIKFDVEQHPISLCPARRNEFEDAMLGGQGNNVSRQATLNDSEKERSEWWDTPVNSC